MCRNAVVFGLHFAVFEPCRQISSNDVLQLQRLVCLFLTTLCSAGLQIRQCKTRRAAQRPREPRVPKHKLAETFVDVCKREKTPPLSQFLLRVMWVYRIIGAQAAPSCSFSFLVSRDHGLAGCCPGPPKRELSLTLTTSCEAARNVDDSCRQRKRNASLEFYAPCCRACEATRSMQVQSS